jgi:hypothetical protein
MAFDKTFAQSTFGRVTRESGRDLTFRRVLTLVDLHTFLAAVDDEWVVLSSVW